MPSGRTSVPGTLGSGISESKSVHGAGPLPHISLEVGGIAAPPAYPERSSLTVGGIELEGLSKELFGLKSLRGRQPRSQNSHQPNFSWETPG